MQLEDLRLHADVVSRDGHKLGSLSRFVFDTKSMRLTHIVVDTGILRSGDSLWKGGWGLSHDRLIPIGAVSEASSDRITITMSGDEFKEHSQDFSEEYFKDAPDARQGAVDSSDLRRLAMSIPGEPGPYLMGETTVLAEGEVDVPDDAPVWRLDPHEKIGEVERVIYDPVSKRLSALVVRRGHFFSKEVSIPPEHIVEVVGGVVRVQMDDAALKSLAEFHPDD